MNARIPMSGNIPAHIAERDSDRPIVYWDEQARLDDLADSIEAENKRMAKQNAGIWLHDAEFWTEELLDSDLPIAADMADAMKHLEAACMEASKLDLSACYFIQKVLGALAGVEKSAKPRAEKQLIDIYGSEK